MTCQQQGLRLLPEMFLNLNSRSPLPCSQSSVGPPCSTHLVGVASPAGQACRLSLPFAMCLPLQPNPKSQVPRAHSAPETSAFTFLWKLWTSALLGDTSILHQPFSLSQLITFSGRVSFLLVSLLDYKSLKAGSVPPSLPVSLAEDSNGHFTVGRNSGRLEVVLLSSRWAPGEQCI